MIDELIDVFDLERPNLVITDYRTEGSTIVITNIDVVDNKNNFLRKADLSKVLPYLSVSNIKFNGKNSI
jgi:hypothetical protein